MWPDFPIDGGRSFGAGEPRRDYPAYRTTLVTPPAEEPVSRNEAKLHLRVEITADDALIDGLIAAARSVVETRTRRALVTQTHDLTLDAFPAGPIRIPNPPLVSVTSVAYTDAAGDAATMAGADYQVSAGTPGRVSLTPSGEWPETDGSADSVVVRYVAGYGAATAVPQAIKQAILLLVGHWYENREAVAPGTSFASLPMAVEALCDSEAWGSWQ